VTRLTHDFFVFGLPPYFKSLHLDFDLLGPLINPRPAFLRVIEFFTYHAKDVHAGWALSDCPCLQNSLINIYNFWFTSTLFHLEYKS